MDHTIKFSQNAVLELVMAGLEAFQADLLKPGYRSSIETIGHLWGYRRILNNEIIHVVDHVSVSIVADRKPSSVSNVPEVAQMKSAVAEYIKPELSFLGDFHTHPYHSDQEVRRVKGWQYSESDENCLINDGVAWNLSANMPLMLVLAICKMEKVHTSDQYELQKNVIRFNISEYRMWLAGYIGIIDPNGVRSISGKTHSSVWVPPLSTAMWHDSGDRLSDYYKEDDS